MRQMQIRVIAQRIAQRTVARNRISEPFSCEAVDAELIVIIALVRICYLEPLQELQGQRSILAVLSGPKKLPARLKRILHKEEAACSKATSEPFARFRAGSAAARKSSHGA